MNVFEAIPVPDSALSVALVLLMGASVAAGTPTKSLPDNHSLDLTEDDLVTLISLCEGCHGPGGNSIREDVPSLAGRPARALFAEIERFYFYERICPDVPVDETDAAKGHMSMCDVTNRMNKPQAEALAEYFENQPPDP